MSNFIVDKMRSYYRRYKNTRSIDMRELYKYWEQEHLKKLFAKYEVDCVFDVGANLGQYARMIRQNADFKGLIISFEPIPKAADALREKAKSDPKWIIVEQALASINGQQLFNIMNISEFSSLSTPLHDEIDIFKNENKIIKSVIVKTETLETAYTRLKSIYNFKKPFLKLDTQGYDVDIVTSSKSVIGEFVGIQSELAVKKIYHHSVDFRVAISTYQQYGFTLSAFVPNNEGHFPVLIETDCIMIRNNLVKSTFLQG
jgi:FkbM family methyltransferase